jgi:hypothetical protein
MKVYAIMDNDYRQGALEFLCHCQGYWSLDKMATEEEFEDMKAGIIEDEDNRNLSLIEIDYKIIETFINEVE